MLQRRLDSHTLKMLRELAAQTEWPKCPGLETSLESALGPALSEAELQAVEETDQEEAQFQSLYLESELAGGFAESLPPLEEEECC